MGLWQKFIFIVTGYWLLERLSRWLLDCGYLRNDVIKTDNRLFPAFKYLIYKDKPRKKKFILLHLVMILILGFGVAHLFNNFEQLPVFIETEDAVGMDWVMRANSNVIPKSEFNFVYLDIDNDTHDYWENPLFTPRNYLLSLIKAASTAKIIIVDIDLSSPTPIDGLNYHEPLHPYDKNLIDYFNNYPDYCKLNPNCPTIILARSLRSNNISRSIFSNNHSLPLSHTKSVFSELYQAVANSNFHIQWASSLFYKSRDQILRRWSLWQPVCIDNRADIMPSITVMTAVLLDSDTPQQAKSKVQQGLSKFKPKNCNESSIELPSQIKLGNLVFSTDLFSVKQRIMYGMSWLQNGKQPNLPYMLSDELDNKVLMILPAKSYTEPNVNFDLLTNKIVIIGGSYSEGHDIHQTPLGKMPGALVLINSIHSLLQYGNIEPLPNWLKLSITALLIMFMGMITLYVSSFGKAQIFNLLLIFILLPISIALLRYGTWLNFATPLIFIQLYQIAVVSVIIMLCLLSSIWRGILQWLHNFTKA